MACWREPSPRCGAPLPDHLHELLTPAGRAADTHALLSRRCACSRVSTTSDVVKDLFEWATVTHLPGRAAASVCRDRRCGPPPLAGDHEVDVWGLDRDVVTGDRSAARVAVGDHGVGCDIPAPRRPDAARGQPPWRGIREPRSWPCVLRTATGRHTRFGEHRGALRRSRRRRGRSAACWLTPPRSVRCSAPARWSRCSATVGCRRGSVGPVPLHLVVPAHALDVPGAARRGRGSRARTFVVGGRRCADSAVDPRGNSPSEVRLACRHFFSDQRRTPR